MLAEGGLLLVPAGAAERCCLDCSIAEGAAAAARPPHLTAAAPLTRSHERRPSGGRWRNTCGRRRRPRPHSARRCCGCGSATKRRWVPGCPQRRGWVAAWAEDHQSSAHSQACWLGAALQVAAALEQVAAATGGEVTLGSYPVRCALLLCACSCLAPHAPQPARRLESCWMALCTPTRVHLLNDPTCTQSCAAAATATAWCSDQVDDAGIVLSLESRCSDALAGACERLKSLLPGGALISEHRDSSAINTPSASPAVGPSDGAEAAAA